MRRDFGIDRVYKSTCLSLPVIFYLSLSPYKSHRLLLYLLCNDEYKETGKSTRIKYIASELFEEKIHEKHLELTIIKNKRW